MTRLILVRHGETLWNSELVYRGRSEIDLSTRGTWQAECLGVSLAQQEISAIYTSPLSRARQTADAIGRATGVDVADEQGLIDLDCGEWEGLSVEEVKRRNPELSRLWQSSPHLVRLPGGESLDDVTQRVAPLLDNVLRQEGVVVLVSHRVVHKVAICALLGLGNSATWQIQIDTAGVTVFDCAAGRNVLQRHNDTSHLCGDCGSIG